METHVMIAELKRVAKKYQGKKLHTFEVYINAMCLEVAERLEELSKHKPSTYEEVVVEWQLLDYQISKHNDSVIMVENKYERKMTFVDNGKLVEFEEIYDMSIEELYAINLTIKYLESLNIHD
jgi:hypothetical protein